TPPRALAGDGRATGRLPPGHDAGRPPGGDRGARVAAGGRAGRRGSERRPDLRDRAGGGGPVRRRRGSRWRRGRCLSAPPAAYRLVERHAAEAMTYFVTGATGFIGRHLVEWLLRRDGQIHVLVREGSAAKIQGAIRAWRRR